MNNKTIEKWTSTCIRYAIPTDNGKWRARKSTHRGCVDYDMVYEDADWKLRYTEYDTPEQALNARAGGDNNWYH